MGVLVCNQITLHRDPLPNETGRFSLAWNNERVTLMDELDTFVTNAITGFAENGDHATAHYLRRFRYFLIAISRRKPSSAYVRNPMTTNSIRSNTGFFVPAFGSNQLTKEIGQAST